MAIKRYMTGIPPGDNDPCPIAWQSMCDGSLPVAAMASAMAAKVGAAA
ncbi:MAG TPA: hypothetical protein VJN66_07345 [Rhodanobacteraceae bacterium]|nr:hypothetical protein [Rhodanobacteraceae bacterium]